MMSKHFIGYEHRDILIDKKYVDIYSDAYPNFGWQIERKTAGKEHHDKTLLKMKRDRKLINQTELKRLQRKFESKMANIEKLERLKTLSPTIVASIIGLIGTAFVAGSIFANDAGYTIGMIVSGTVGLVGWILPYPVFKHRMIKSTHKYQPLIDHEYDLVYEICEKAYTLSRVID
ncbi:MAG: hypothetical protein ABF908_03420 [Lentilactobacillus diolivorans]